MLTSVYCQAYSITMVVVQSDHQAARSAQQTLVAQLLQPLLARRRPERILILKHAAAGDLPLQAVNTAQVIRLSTDEFSVDAMLRCRIAALPFEEAAFDLVILHHLLGDGSEAFMAETFRVMAAGGDLVISGLNSSGLRNRIANRKQELPALKLNKVCNFLKSHSFNIENCLLMGLAGLSRPAPTATWNGLGLPFADRVVLHGHHQSNIKNASILSFKNVRAARVAPAALDGISSREAAS
jgi:SAM-dependent methyltransferase